MSALGKARAALEVAEKLADRTDDGWRLRAYAAGLDLGKQQEMNIDYANVLALVACAERSSGSPQFSRQAREPPA